KRQMPEALIITPESLHLLIGQKGYADIFKNLRIIAVDEWHELLGSKRGVQVELAVSRLMNVNRQSSIVNEEENSKVKSQNLKRITYNLQLLSGVSAPPSAILMKQEKC